MYAVAEKRTQETTEADLISLELRDRKTWRRRAPLGYWTLVH